MQSVTETVVNAGFFIPTNAAVIGFAVVVVLLLAILIAVLRKPSGKAPAPAPSAEYQAVPAPAVYAGVDGAVVAAIAAAVAMIGQAEGKRLVVRSVRRSGGWAAAGRRESAY